MATIKGGVPLAGFASPTDEQDTYAVTDVKYQRGGFRAVENINLMNSITSDRKQEGMWIWVIGTQELYQLRNNKYEKLTLGGANIDEINKLLEAKANVSDVYNKQAIDKTLEDYVKKTALTSIMELKGTKADLIELNKVTGQKPGDTYIIETNKVKTFYTWDATAWVSLGSNLIDLSGYYTKKETDAKLDEKINKTDAVTKVDFNKEQVRVNTELGKKVNSDDYTDTVTQVNKNKTDIAALSNKLNAVDPTKLATKQELTDAKNTLQTNIDGKVDTATMNTELNKKANKTDLDKKADKTALDAKADRTEVEKKADKTEVGTLSDLVTNEKTDLVKAINELDANIKAGGVDTTPFAKKNEANIFEKDNTFKTPIVIEGNPGASEQHAVTVKYLKDYLKPSVFEKAVITLGNMPPGYSYRALGKLLFRHQGMYWEMSAASPASVTNIAGVTQKVEILLKRVEKLSAGFDGGNPIPALERNYKLAENECKIRLTWTGGYPSPSNVCTAQNIFNPNNGKNHYNYYLTYSRTGTDDNTLIIEILEGELKFDGIDLSLIGYNARGVDKVTIDINNGENILIFGEDGKVPPFDPIHKDISYSGMGMMEGILGANNQWLGKNAYKGETIFQNRPTVPNIKGTGLKDNELMSYGDYNSLVYGVVKKIVINANGDRPSKRGYRGFDFLYLRTKEKFWNMKYIEPGLVANAANKVNSINIVLKKEDTESQGWDNHNDYPILPKNYILGSDEVKIKMTWYGGYVYSYYYAPYHNLNYSKNKSYNYWLMNSYTGDDKDCVITIDVLDGTLDCDRIGVNLNPPTQVGVKGMEITINDGAITLQYGDYVADPKDEIVYKDLGTKSIKNEILTSDNKWSGVNVYNTVTEFNKRPIYTSKDLSLPSLNGFITYQEFNNLAYGDIKRVDLKITGDKASNKSYRGFSKFIFKSKEKFWNMKYIEKTPKNQAATKQSVILILKKEDAISQGWDAINKYPIMPKDYVLEANEIKLKLTWYEGYYANSYYQAFNIFNYFSPGYDSYITYFLMNSGFGDTPECYMTMEVLEGVLDASHIGINLNPLEHSGCKGIELNINNGAMVLQYGDNKTDPKDEIVYKEVTASSVTSNLLNGNNSWTGINMFSNNVLFQGINPKKDIIKGKTLEKEELMNYGDFQKIAGSGIIQKADFKITGDVVGGYRGFGKIMFKQGSKFWNTIYIDPAVYNTADGTVQKRSAILKLEDTDMEGWSNYRSFPTIPGEYKLGKDEVKVEVSWVGGYINGYYYNGHYILNRDKTNGYYCYYMTANTTGIRDENTVSLKVVEGSLVADYLGVNLNPTGRGTSGVEVTINDADKIQYGDNKTPSTNEIIMKELPQGGLFDPNANNRFKGKQTFQQQIELLDINGDYLEATKPEHALSFGQFDKVMKGETQALHLEISNPGKYNNNSVYPVLGSLQLFNGTVEYRPTKYSLTKDYKEAYVVLTTSGNETTATVDATVNDKYEVKEGEFLIHVKTSSIYSTHYSVYSAFSRTGNTLLWFGSGTGNETYDITFLNAYITSVKFITYDKNNANWIYHIKGNSGNLIREYDFPTLEGAKKAPTIEFPIDSNGLEPLSKKSLFNNNSENLVTAENKFTVPPILENDKKELVLATKPKQLVSFGQMKDYVDGLVTTKGAIVLTFSNPDKLTIPYDGCPNLGGLAPWKNGAKMFCKTYVNQNGGLGAQFLFVKDKVTAVAANNIDINAVDAENEVLVQVTSLTQYSGYYAYSSINTGYNSTFWMAGGYDKSKVTIEVLKGSPEKFTAIFNDGGYNQFTPKVTAIIGGATKDYVFKTYQEAVDAGDQDIPYGSLVSKADDELLKKELIAYIDKAIADLKAELQKP